MHPKFLQYMDIEKVETLYKRLILIDLSDMPDHRINYINGALDACLSVIGVDTRLSKLLDIDENLTREEMIEVSKSTMRYQYPDAEEITGGYRNDAAIERIDRESEDSDTFKPH